MSHNVLLLFLLLLCQLAGWRQLLAVAMSPKHLDRAASDICLAAKCECQKNGEEHEEDEEEGGMAANNEEEMEVEDDSSSFPGLSVRCLRGPTNDSDFLALLQSLPADTRQLELRGAPGRPCQLHWSDNINRLSRLRRLALVDCGVPALSQAVRLPLLSQLHLAGNGLEQLQLGSFLGLPMLQELDLSRNRISSLSTGAFLYLKNLRSLSLSHNRFGPELSTGNLLHGPRQLRVLELDGNRLSAKQLNDLFPDLTALERLELNHCGLNDAELWALNWSAVPQLRRVGLAGNNLTQVPSTSLRALAWLDTLDLRENLIRSLGPCIFCGMNVSRALLGRNLLGLSARPVHREAFAETRIRELDLGYNHFRHFDSEMLAGAQPWVEVLHLSGNSLSLDSPGLIRTLPRLRELHMAECGLASSSGVPYSLPKQFQQLTLLNLSGNGLDHLPPNLGSLLPQLQVLDISHNRFSSLPHQLWPFVDSLRLLFLHHCPWDCECAAQPLQLQMLQRLAQRELLRFEDTRCAEPPLLRGQPLHRVQRINDCAVLFGANFGITQNTELLLILAALLVAAFFFSLLLLLLLYCGREAKQKGTYVTGEKKPLAAKEPSSNGNGLLLVNSGGKGGAGGLLTAVGNGTTTSSTGGLLALSPDFGDLSPPVPLGDGPVSSTMLRPLTVQGLAREKQPLLDEADWNHNCIGPVTRGGGGGGGTLVQPSLLLVQSKGPRHPLPAQQQQQQRSTLLTF